MLGAPNAAFLSPWATVTGASQLPCPLGMHVHIHTCMYTMHTHADIHMCTHMCSCTHANTHTSMHKHKHIYVFTHIHVLAYTHAHIHTCTDTCTTCRCTHMCTQPIVRVTNDTSKMIHNMEHAAGGGGSRRPAQCIGEELRCWSEAAIVSNLVSAPAAARSGKSAHLQLRFPCL